MKTSDRGADTTERQPAATQSPVLEARTSHGVSLQRHVGWQSAVNQSPRLQLQRQTLQAALGTVRQREVGAVEDAHRSKDAGVKASGGRLLTDAGDPVGRGQIGTEDFLEQMRQQVMVLSKEILGPHGLAQDDCPDLRFWVEHYRAKGAAYTEAALARYAPGTQEVDNWAECLALLVERVRRGLIEHTRTGESLDPEPMPDARDRERPPLSTLGIGPAKEVAQLQCASKQAVDDGGQKYTMEDVMKATGTDPDRRAKENRSLSGLLSGPRAFTEEERLRFFGVRDEQEHMAMASVVVAGSGSPERFEEGRLEFLNAFGPRGIVIAENFKDSDLVAGNLFLNEVIQHQWTVSGVKTNEEGLKYIAVRHVISKDSTELLQKDAFADGDPMSDDQKGKFLATGNGKACQRLVAAQRNPSVEIERAFVLTRDGIPSVVLKLKPTGD